MYFPHLNILLILLKISLISCETKNLNYEDFLKKLEKYEIVYPKVLNKSEIRPKRSSPEAPEERNINLNIFYISLNDLTIKASENENLMVPKSFESHWIKTGERKVSIEDSLRLQKCLAVQGIVTQVPGSSVVLTICDNEIFGLVMLKGKPHFIQPINDDQHVMYETNIPKKFENMVKSGGINFGENIYDKFENRGKRALTICDTREKIKLTKDLAGIDYLDMVDPATHIDDPAEHMNPFLEHEPFGRAMTRGREKVRRTYNRRSRHISSRWIKMIVGVDYDVIEFHNERTHQYVYTILNIVSTLFKQISKTMSLKIVVLKLYLYPDPSESAIHGGDTRYPLYSVNRWNRVLWQEAREKHDMSLWMTQYELHEDVKTVPGAFMCQYQWHCILVEDAGWLSAIKIAHAIGHLIGMTHDGDLMYNNNCASESLLHTTIMSSEIPTVIPIPVWSSCSIQEFHNNILKYHCLERPPVHFENSAFMSGVFSLDEQCRIEFGDGWLFCSRILVPDPCKELWCNRATGSRRSCLTRQTPTLEGTACGRGRRCINHTCEEAKRPSVETTTVTELPEEPPSPDIPYPEPSTEPPRATPPPINTPHPALFNPPSYFDPSSMTGYSP